MKGKRGKGRKGKRKSSAVQGPRSKQDKLAVVIAECSEILSSALSGFSTVNFLTWAIERRKHHDESCEGFFGPRDCGR